MGGNALKEYGAKRIESSEFNIFSTKLASALNNILAKSGIEQTARMIPSYREKSSHGDIDVVLPKSLRVAVGDQAMLRLLEEQLAVSNIPVKTNGDVASYGIPFADGGVFQVDLIYMAEEDLDFALSYFSWNDVGNLIGRIAHKMGLKYAHNGLYLPIRDENYLFETILITRDFAKTINFLGFSFDRWSQGFNNLEEIYEFTVSCHRFSTNTYLLENLKHTARVRDKKRPAYTNFLKWLEEHPEKDKNFVWPEDKSVWLEEIFRAFPDKKVEWESALVKLGRARDIKAKYNGALIESYTGLNGRELGEFIQLHHSKFDSKEAFNLWVYENNEETIKTAIIDLAKLQGKVHT
ncbi:hypothetical protein ACI2KR_08650 [Pseudomonas luteola]